MPINVKLAGAVARKLARSGSCAAVNVMRIEPVSLMLRNEFEAMNWS